MGNLLKNVKIGTVDQAYLGADKACRCGCKGNYTYPNDDPKKSNPD